MNGLHANIRVRLRSHEMQDLYSTMRVSREVEQEIEYQLAPKSLLELHTLSNVQWTSTLSHPPIVSLPAWIHSQSKPWPKADPPIFQRLTFLVLR